MKKGEKWLTKIYFDVNKISVSEYPGFDFFYQDNKVIIEWNLTNNVAFVDYDIKYMMMNFCGVSSTDCYYETLEWLTAHVLKKRPKSVFFMVDEMLPIEKLKK